MTKFSLSFICFFFFSIGLIAQITLENPSFEGDAQDATVPIGWHPCAKGTTPDILPGFWGVYTEPSEGETFLGLISREDGSFESIGQQLSQPLEKACYTFSIDLAYSRSYSGYNMPLQLKIWGGKTKCAKSQLLVETEFIEHDDWKTYDLSFIVKKKNINYIIFEAQPAPGVFFAYKGNILIDNCSVIKQCDRAFLELAKETAVTRG